MVVDVLVIIGWMLEGPLVEVIVVLVCIDWWVFVWLGEVVVFFFILVFVECFWSGLS